LGGSFAIAGAPGDARARLFAAKPGERSAGKRGTLAKAPAAGEAA